MSIDFIPNEPPGLLRINHCDTGKWLLIAQILFPTGQAAVNIFDGFEPAVVAEHGAELGEPWAHAVGHQVRDPDLDFGGALNRVFPAIGFLDADTENTDD